MAKKLYITFEDSDHGTTRTLSINGAKEGLRLADVESAANTLITLKALDGIRGKFDTFKGAEYKETVVEELA